MAISLQQKFLAWLVCADECSMFGSMAVGMEAGFNVCVRNSNSITMCACEFAALEAEQLLHVSKRCSN